MGEREGGGIPEANFFVVADFVVAVAVAVAVVVVSLATSKCKLPGDTGTSTLLLPVFPWLVVVPRAGMNGPVVPVSA